MPKQIIEDLIVDVATYISHNPGGVARANVRSLDNYMYSATQAQIDYALRQLIAWEMVNTEPMYMDKRQDVLYPAGELDGIRGADDFPQILRNIIRAHRQPSTKKRKNTNLLEGMKCPQCGSLGSFVVEMRVVMRVTDEALKGIEGEPFWDNDSWCICDKCSAEGDVRDFQIKKGES
jgi:hypothetical protein